MKKKILHLFTPLVSEGSQLRAHMLLADEDAAKVFVGNRESAAVFDHESGRTYDVKLRTKGGAVVLREVK